MTSLHSSFESPWLWHPYTAVLKAPGYDILTQQFWKSLVMTSLHSSFESPWLWHPYTAVLKAPGYDILTQQFWKPLVMTSLNSSFKSPWLWHPYTGPCFHYWCSVYGICKWSDTLWPVGRVRLFADYTISLSSLCRLIWKHWTTKMLVRYMMPSVCLRLRQFSQLSLYSLYGAVCLQLTQLSCDDRENVYFILSSNRKYESLTIV